jgi:hypothetical protein
MNYKTIIALNLILLLFGSLSAQNDSEVRNLIKTFPVGKETSLEIYNKYGTIHITPWSKDTASIRAEVKAFAANQSKLSKMFDGITINITDSKYLVRAKTDFTQNISMLFESFKGMTSKLISYDSRVEINYYISIPEYMNLKIENKYGDVYIEDCTGDFSLSLSNGSFKANSIRKGSSITLAFCDANINSLTTGKINASFSDITIGETEDISINSVSTKYDIREAGIIFIESRRDKFFIGNISKMVGNSYFTEYDLNNIKKGLNLTPRYGNIRVDLIEKGFETIEINSGYADISLKFEPGSSYKIDVRHTNAFLVLPDKNTTEQKALNEDKKEYMTYGTIGQNPGSARVKIDATRGNIYIK